MVINKSTLISILQRLADSYPFMLKPEGYSRLLSEFEESILDGHILYLWENGLIETDMRFDQQQEAWEINFSITRINASGLDYLAESRAII